MAQDPDLSGLLLDLKFFVLPFTEIIHAASQSLAVFFRNSVPFAN